MHARGGCQRDIGLRVNLRVLLKVGCGSGTEERYELDAQPLGLCLRCRSERIVDWD